MTRTGLVAKATREPVSGSRKSVAKEYGAKAEYSLTAYERKRLERKGLLPLGSSPEVVPGAADCDATPAQDAPANPSGRRVHLS